MTVDGRPVPAEADRARLRAERHAKLQAQLAAHGPLPAAADFLAWSGHKMYAPFGAGVLVGPRSAFTEGDPFLAGGGAAFAAPGRRPPSKKAGLAMLRDVRYTAYYPKRNDRRRREAAVMDPRLRLQQVLAGQQFPAERWELIVVADLYGADAFNKSELHALPAVRFRSLAHVLHAVQRLRQRGSPQWMRSSLVQQVFPLQLQFAAPPLKRSILLGGLRRCILPLGNLFFHRFAFPSTRHTFMLLRDGPASYT